MSELELSSSQERILTALVNLADGDDSHADGKDSVVCGRAIAEAIGRDPGTVRNRMQGLRALGLVEGVPGPNGGYMPTSTAYETLDIEPMEDPARVPVERAGSRLDGVNVQEIDLSSVNNPELCRAEVVLRGSARHFEGGDRVTVGPTPTAGLRLSGVVDAADIDGNTLMVRVDSMETATGPEADVPEESRSASD